KDATRYTVSCQKHGGLVGLSCACMIDNFVLASGKMDGDALLGVLARCVIGYQEAADCDCEVPDGPYGSGLAGKVMARRSNELAHRTRHQREEVHMPSSSDWG